MKWGKTLLVLLGLIVLSGYLYIFEIRGGAEKKLAEERKKQAEWRSMQLFPYQPHEFKKITLFKEGTTIVYGKEEGVWWMKEPLAIKGSERAVDDIILSILNVVETDPAGDNPTDLAQFGLDAPPFLFLLCWKAKRSRRPFCWVSTIPLPSPSTPSGSTNRGCSWWGR